MKQYWRKANCFVCHEPLPSCAEFVLEEGCFDPKRNQDHGNIAPNSKLLRKLAFTFKCVMKALVKNEPVYCSVIPYAKLLVRSASCLHLVYESLLVTERRGGSLQCRAIQHNLMPDAVFQKVTDTQEWEQMFCMMQHCTISLSKGSGLSGLQAYEARSSGTKKKSPILKHLEKTCRDVISLRKADI